MRRLKHAAYALALLLVAGVLAALPLSQYSKTASENGTGATSTVPDGAPENWTGSQINDTLRQFMAVVRTWYDDPQWIEVTFALPTRGTKTLSRVDADTLDILAADARSYFTSGRRIQIVGSSTVTCYLTANSTLNGSDTRLEVGTSCSVPTSPTAVNAYFGADLRSGAFSAAGADSAGIVVGRGLFNGRIAYASASTVTIGRGYNQKLTVEIDGVLTEGSSDLTVDLASADREDTASCSGSASEQASTWYYLYLDEASGVAVEHISSTAPVMDPASGKVGYHPGTCAGSTGWRAVGAVFNNASSNIQPFDVNPETGLWLFRSIVSAFTKSPGIVSQASYTTISLSGNVPAIARAARLAIRLRDPEDVTWYYGHESLSGTVSTTPASCFAETSLGGGSNNPGGAAICDVAVDSTPSFAWGNVVTNLGGSSGLGAVHTIDPVGYYADLGLVH